MSKDSGSWRARWAAVGAAVAVAVGAGGGIAITNAAVGSGERDVFVPITPCRLLDTRPTTQVGPRNTPLGPAETYTQAVRGSNGNCSIPTDAVAVAMNMTVTDGTAGSFLTVWPSDVATRPVASSLNWQGGDAARPNKVDVRLSADGKINLFNAAGTVNVLADVVGYYADHTHDDRYPQKIQVTFDLAAGAISAPITVPPNVPVSLTAATLTAGDRGIAHASLLSIPGSFVQWIGQESTSVTVLSGFAITPNVHLVNIDNNHTVDIQSDTPTTIRIHNNSATQQTGLVTMTW